LASFKGVLDNKKNERNRTVLHKHVGEAESEPWKKTWTTGEQKATQPNINEQSNRENSNARTAREYVLAPSSRGGPKNTW